MQDHVDDRPGEAPILDGTADTTHTPPEQSGMRNSNDRSRLHNAFGIPAGLSFGSLQAPVLVLNIPVNCGIHLARVNTAFV